MSDERRNTATDSENESTSSFLNWGTGLAIAIILFVVSTLSVVAYITNLDYHMVSENHYEKAVQYQQHIDRMIHTRNLDAQIEIKTQPDFGEIRIGFPLKLLAPRPTGTVTLYRPSDSRLDRTFELKLDDDGKQHIPVSELKSGKWLIRITWEAGEKGFFKEDVIFL